MSESINIRCKSFQKSFLRCVRKISDICVPTAEKKDRKKNFHTFRTSTSRRRYVDIFLVAQFWHLYFFYVYFSLFENHSSERARLQKLKQTRWKRNGALSCWFRMPKTLRTGLSDVVNRLDVENIVKQPTIVQFFSRRRRSQKGETEFFYYQIRHFICNQ